MCYTNLCGLATQGHNSGLISTEVEVDVLYCVLDWFNTNQVLLCDDGHVHLSIPFGHIILPPIIIFVSYLSDFLLPIPLLVAYKLLLLWWWRWWCPVSCLHILKSSLRWKQLVFHFTYFHSISQESLADMVRPGTVTKFIAVVKKGVAGILE